MLIGILLNEKKKSIVLDTQCKDCSEVFMYSFFNIF